MPATDAAAWAPPKDGESGRETSMAAAARTRLAKSRGGPSDASRDFGALPWRFTSELERARRELDRVRALALQTPAGRPAERPRAAAPPAGDNPDCGVVKWRGVETAERTSGVSARCTCGCSTMLAFTSTVCNSSDAPTGATCGASGMCCQLSADCERAAAAAASGHTCRLWQPLQRYALHPLGQWLLCVGHKGA